MESQENQSDSSHENERSSNGKTTLATVVAVIVIIFIIVAIIVLATLLGILLVDYYGNEKQPLTETVKKNSVPDKPWLNVRLPKSLVPHHYEVDLRPVLTASNNGSYWFYGNSTVYFTVNEATHVILIHSSKLHYDDIQVKDHQGMEIGIKRNWTYDDNEYLVIELEKRIDADKKCSLNTVFYGELANDHAGLYRTSYVNAKKKTVIIAASQLETVWARKTFPCFDEPALKATFDIFLWHKYPNFALSNMPVERIEDIEDWNRTKFERTPRMSTYLLAFVISDFDFEESFTTGSPRIQTRVYGRPDKVSSRTLEFAKSIAPRILDYFTEFFGVPYPLPKSDQVAVPDFYNVAMENWGLILYNDIFLFIDRRVSSVSAMQDVATWFSHELSHQWFGNIISPLWWDEIWLNEGFATFVQYLGMEHIEPTFRMSDQFIIKETHRAMEVDGLLSSRPIVAENVETVDEINALFDSISYAKGACLIRMIKAFVGDEAFRLGLKNYLEEYKYGSVVHQELFKFWAKAVNDTKAASYPPGGFENAMNTWVLQMGFPTINVKRRSSSSEQVVVSQERFLLNPDANVTQPSNELGYRWVIPFWYRMQNNPSNKLIWMKPHTTHAIEVPVEKYIIGNYEVFGYYRVNYDKEMWKIIINQLNNDFEEINTKSRGQLINDAFNLARARKLSYEIALNLTMFLRSDHDYIPWKCAIDVFTYLTEMLGRSKVYRVYSEYIKDLSKPLYDALFDGVTNKRSHLDIFQKSNAIILACSNGNQNCTDMINKIFRSWKTNPRQNTIDVDLRDAVYCQAVAHGGSEEWYFVWMQYKNENNAEEKSRLLNALACTRSSLLIDRLLNFTRNGTYIGKQDGSKVLINLCNNDFARDRIWDFLRAEWKYIRGAYDSALLMFPRIIQSCTSSFSTAFELQNLKGFMKINENNLGSTLNAFNQAVEQTKANMQWRADNEDVILNWLKLNTDVVA